MMESNKIAEIQIEALVVYNYMVLYDIFEHKLKDVFVNQVKKVRYNESNSSKIERLYFYLGGVGIYSNYIDYDTYSTISTSNKFGDFEMINRFTLMQMIRIDEKEKILDCFQVNIDSINNPKMIQYTFHTCCKKLTKLRNSLAHDFSNLRGNEQNSIEVLSDNKIDALKPKWLAEVDVKNMNDKSKLIFCNYIYMEKLQGILDKVGT